MDISSLCPRFFISVQTVRLMCIDEAWLASSVFLLASMPGPFQKQDVFVGFMLSLHGSVTGYAPTAAEVRKCSSVTEFM